MRLGSPQGTLSRGIGWCRRRARAGLGLAGGRACFTRDGRFDQTNPIFHNRWFFFLWRERFDGGTLLLEAAELGQRPEMPAVFGSEAALDLLQEGVGGRVSEQGEQVRSGIEEPGFQTAPTLFIPLGEEHGAEQPFLGSAEGMILVEVSLGERLQFGGVFAADEVRTKVEAEAPTGDGRRGGRFGCGDWTCHTTPR